MHRCNMTSLQRAQIPSLYFTCSIFLQVWRLWHNRGKSTHTLYYTYIKRYLWPVLSGWNNLILSSTVLCSILKAETPNQPSIYSSHPSCFAKPGLHPVGQNHSGCSQCSVTINASKFPQVIDPCSNLPPPHSTPPGLSCLLGMCLS